jgi:hypothetical protein
VSLEDIRKRLNGEQPAEEMAIVAIQSKTITVTAGELREVCKANPAHPNTRVFTNAVKDFPDNREVIVEQIDLQAVMDNQEVEIAYTVKDGQKVRTKRLLPKQSEEQPTE